MSEGLERRQVLSSFILLTVPRYSSVRLACLEVGFSVVTSVRKFLTIRLAS